MTCLLREYQSSSLVLPCLTYVLSKKVLHMTESEWVWRAEATVRMAREMFLQSGFAKVT